MTKYRFDYTKIRRGNIVVNCIKEFNARFSRYCIDNAMLRGLKVTEIKKKDWEPSKEDVEYAENKIGFNFEHLNKWISDEDIDNIVKVHTNEETQKEIVEQWNVIDDFKWYDSLNYNLSEKQNAYETYVDLYYRDKDGNPTLRYSTMDDKVTCKGYLFGKGNLRADFRNYGYKYCGGDVQSIIDDIYDTVIRWEENNPYSFDELREYLDNLPEWDGIERLENLFIKYQKAPDCKYVRTATRNWFVNAVRQVYAPCKHPFLGMLVLHGETDCGKTATLEHMFQINGEDRFTYNVDMKDSQQKIASILRTKWALGFGERVGIAKEENNIQKQFMDTINATISYQKKFQNEVTDYKPHNCVYVSSNDKTLLNDYTVAYNKRYLIIPCKITAREYQNNGYWQETKDIREQIWAEALYQFRLDPEQKLILNDDEIEELIEIQKQYMTIDEDDVKFDVHELIDRKWSYDVMGNYRVLKNEEDFVQQFKHGVNEYGVVHKGKINCFPCKYIKTWMKMKDMDSRMRKMIENAFTENGWVKKQVKYYGSKCWCYDIKDGSRNDASDTLL